MKIYTKSDTIPTRPLVVAIYGQPGIGKTSLSFTAPEPFIFDFDRGIARAYQEDRPEFGEITTYAAFRESIFGGAFASYAGQQGIKTVVIDTVGTCLDDFIAPYLIQQNPKFGRAGGLSISGWGALANEFNDLKNRIVSMGLHLILIAHEKEEGDGDQKQIRMAVKGGSSDMIYRISDMIGYCYVEGKSRTIDFEPTSIHLGKNTAGLPKLKMPKPGTPAYSNFMADAVIKKCQQAMSQKSAAAVEAAKIVKAYQKEIDGLETPEDFQTTTDKIAGLNNKTIETQLRAYFTKQMEKAGIKYSKSAGGFIYDEPEQDQEEDEN
jgi:hypothetical protein